MSKQDELQYEQQEKRIQAQSDAFITLLTKRGILGDSQIDDAQKRAARQEKTKNCYHNTLMLLQHYRTLVWMLECFPETVAAELDRPFEGVDKLIEDVDVEVALGNKKIESRMQGMQKSRLLMDRLNEALTVLRKKPDNGERLYNLIYTTYIAPEVLNHQEVLYRLNLSSRNFYRYRQQAISVLSIRLWATAAPDVDFWLEMVTLHPNAYRYYMDAFWEHKFPGNAAHRDRNHRVAETVAMCMRSGVECRPYMLPVLQNRTITQRIPDAPCFYLAKELKKLGEAEMNKTMFTRMVGTAYLGQRPYAVYNTRSAVMKWSGKGEFKTLHSVIEISRLNTGTDATPAAILFGQSESVALKTLLESDTTKRPEFRFDAVYRNLYFIPMNEHGIRQLRLMTIPEWKERLLELLFDPDVRTYDRGLFEYDAKIGDAYVFSHLDGDLARLVRFKEAVENQRGNYEVLCYPYQMAFIREYLGSRVRIKTIGFDAVEAELDPERRDLFER